MKKDKAFINVVGLLGITSLSLGLLSGCSKSKIPDNVIIGGEGSGSVAVEPSSTEKRIEDILLDMTDEATPIETESIEESISTESVPENTSLEQDTEPEEESTSSTIEDTTEEDTTSESVTEEEWVSAGGAAGDGIIETEGIPEQLYLLDEGNLEFLIKEIVAGNFLDYESCLTDGCRQSLLVDFPFGDYRELEVDHVEFLNGIDGGQARIYFVDEEIEPVFIAFYLDCTGDTPLLNQLSVFGLSDDNNNDDIVSDI